MTASEQSKKEINDALWNTHWAAKIDWDAHAKARQERPMTRDVRGCAGRIRSFGVTKKGN
jgi:hypothetical protein